MKVLVTGAAGFIGKHVCKLLIEEGHYVIALDAVWPSVTMPLSEGFTRLADITQPLDPIDNLDAVIHLAAMANPRECDANPGKAFDVNVNGTHQVLKMALESGAKKVVFSSTAHVYDIPPRYLPTDEVHPLRLNNTYTTTKILGEQLCELYWENHGLSYTTLRLFNAYGPGQQTGYFIPDMIQKAKNGGIELSDGLTSKDFVYVDDVARAFVNALETPFVGPINIGTGVESHLGYVASNIAEKLGVSFAHTDGSGSHTHMQSDSTRARTILGWEPIVTIKEGLDAILATESRPVPAQP